MKKIEREKKERRLEHLQGLRELKLQELNQIQSLTKLGVLRSILGVEDSTSATLRLQRVQQLGYELEQINYEIQELETELREYIEQVSGEPESSEKDIFCFHCGAQLPSNAVTCLNCGKNPYPF